MVLLPDINEKTNLVELSRWQAQNNPDRKAITFLPDGEDQEFHLTFQELDERARALAACLQRQTRPGDRALILYPPGLDAIVGLYGCLYAGLTAVLTGLPRPNTPLDGLQATAEQSQAKLALTTTPFLTSISSRISQSELKSLCWIATDHLPVDIPADDWQMPGITPDMLAILIFTSGSTNTPKGVMISHSAIVSEMNSVGKLLNITPASVAVSWAPLYHIGGILLPLILPASGMRFLLMPTQVVMERPIRWLKALTRYQADITFSFNFGLQTSVERTTPEERAGLDLSHCANCMVGGERLRADLMDQFVTAFAPYGFRRQALRPSYGLTESVGPAAAVGQNPPGYQVYVLDQEALEQNRAILAEPGKKKTQLHVGNGGDVPAKPIRIVDPNTRAALPAGQIGEIWISSAHIAAGYWNRPEETRDSFQAYTADTKEGPFFRTGDLGCKLNDDLIITGRLKEMIILHGKNYYSQDLERTVEPSHPALQPGGVAAFPLTDWNEERLAIACEIKRDIAVADLDVDGVIGAVRRAIAMDQQQTVHVVALVKAGSLPRSTSGKLLRFACREALAAGKLDAIKISSLEDGGQPRANSASGYVAPSTPIERALVGIWSGVLGKTRIGVNDNFFELGGDSLMGAQIIAQVQDVFQMELPTRLLFETPTVAGMARIINDVRKNLAR